MDSKWPFFVAKNKYGSIPGFYMNKIILIGCLVQNPKVVASEGKKTAAYFRVAVNRKYGSDQF